MQMPESEPKSARGRTGVRSRRRSGAADAAVAQNIEKSAAYARKPARRAGENIAAPAARMLAPACRQARQGEHSATSLPY